MATGIRIVNQFGTILIDNKYPTMTLRSKGTATIGTSGQVRFSGATTGRVALRATSLVSCRYFPQELTPYARGWYAYGVPGTVFDWWVFDDPVEPPKSPGLWVRNAQQGGKLMFDAGALPLRVVDIRSGPALANWAASAYYPAGRTYAVMPMVAAFEMQMSFSRAGAGSPSDFLQTERIRLAGGLVIDNMVNTNLTSQASHVYGPYTGTPLPTNYSGAANNAALAIVDVTGY